MKKSLTALLIAASWALVAAAPAQGAPDPLDSQVSAVLAEFPNGTRTSYNTISWEDGAVVLTLASPNTVVPMSVGSCATGAYCAYNGASLTGSKLSFTTCTTTVSLAALPGVVRSIANARSSGIVQGRNASGTTLTTVAAGGQVNSAPAGVTHLRCTV